MLLVPFDIKTLDIIGYFGNAIETKLMAMYHKATTVHRHSDDTLLTLCTAFAGE